MDCTDLKNFRTERLRRCAVILLTLWLALVLSFSWNPSPFAQVIAAFAILLSLMHAVLSYGSKNALVFFTICASVSFVIENIGVSTGVPFGHYHFVVGDGFPHVGFIPIIVGPLWFGVGYLSFVVAAILLDDADVHLNRHVNFFALPFVSALIMTQWDFTMDRTASTFFGAWNWHDGGPDFGVPIKNYFGWILTSWLFFQCFVFYLRNAGVPVRAAQPILRRSAVVFYLGAAFTHLTPWLIGSNGEVVDAAGRLWRQADAHSFTLIAMVLTMGYSGALATIKLEKKKSDF